MLGTLRRHKDSLFVKILMGLFALMFIGFFGSKSLRNNSLHNGRKTPAIVNGTAINSIKTQFLIDQQMDNLKEQFKDKIPDNFALMIRQNIINNLVNTELVNQEVHKLGLATSAKELQNYITTNPQFQQDGEFNKAGYLNNFLPWYQERQGTAFESDVRDELALQKIISEFDMALSPDENFLKKMDALNNTKYKFSVIKVRKQADDKEDVLPKDLKDDKTPSEPTKTDSTDKADQKPLAEGIFSKWKSGQKIDDILATNKLKINGTPELGLPQLASVLDGKDDMSALKKISALTATVPFPDQIFDEGGYYYLIRFESVKPPSTAPTADVLDKLKNDYQQSLSSSLESAWIHDLRDHAKIEIENP